MTAPLFVVEYFRLPPRMFGVGTTEMEYSPRIQQTMKRGGHPSIVSDMFQRFVANDFVKSQP
jgi:hypothetical protein